MIDTSSIISTLYRHLMSVSRIQDVEDEWGRTKQGYHPIPSLQLVKCKYSQLGRGGNTTRSESTNTIKTIPKVYCHPSLDIRAGDRIVINYGTKILGNFTAGEPYIYASHQEIPITKVGEA